MKIIKTLKYKKHTELVRKALKSNPDATAYALSKVLPLHSNQIRLILKRIEEIEGNKPKITSVITKKEAAVILGTTKFNQTHEDKLIEMGYTKVKSTKFPFQITYVK